MQIRDSSFASFQQPLGFIAMEAVVQYLESLGLSLDPRSPDAARTVDVLQLFILQYQANHNAAKQQIRDLLGDGSSLNSGGLDVAMENSMFDLFMAKYKVSLQQDDLCSAIEHGLKGQLKIEAIDEAISLYSAFNTPNSSRPVDRQLAYFKNMFDLHISRVQNEEKVENINGAIDYGNKYLAIAPMDNQSTTEVCDHLAYVLTSRFEATGSIDDLSESIRLGRQALEATLRSAPEYSNRLNSLTCSLSARFNELYELPDIDEAIELTRSRLSETKSDDPVYLWLLNNLGSRYLRRY